MKVYFVRHGESKQNFAKAYQHPDIELFETGLKQAQTIANRFVHLPVDVILCSTNKRAEQTADFIRKVVNKRIIHTDLLRERKASSELIGRSYTDEDVLKIREHMRQMAMKDSHWHYSDEENFLDIKVRAGKVLDLLDKRKEKKILVVSHAFTLKMIICLMAFGDYFDAKIYYSFFENFELKNTGLTVCEKKDGKWKIVTWNDHAHLGE